MTLKKLSILFFGVCFIVFLFAIIVITKFGVCYHIFVLQVSYAYL